MKKSFPFDTPEGVRQYFAGEMTEKNLADAYAVSSNTFWWVEDDVYDYEEGTEEFREAQGIVHAWFEVMEEYQDKIFEILDSEGVTIPSSGQNAVLVPFMERNGYDFKVGWWIEKSDNE